MMDSLRRAWNRVRAFFGSPELDADLAAEMDSHLQYAIEENIQNGMTPAEARRKALVRFGGVQQATERHRETRGLPWLEVLLQDSRYSLRTLWKDKAFSLVAVLILALGIGANVTVFSVVNGLLLRPLPFRDPQRLVWLASNKGQGGLSAVTFTVDAYEQFQHHNQSFADLTSYQTFFNSISYKMKTQGQPLPVFGIQVAENFFPMLGVQPALGRQFFHEECQKGGRPAALLSYAFWKRQFAGDASVVGRAITLNEQAVTVVGVLPASFDFGSVFSPGLSVDFFVPAVMDFWRTWGNTLAVVGRLKPGVPLARAQAESDILFPQLQREFHWYEDYSSTMSTLQDHVAGKLRRSLIVLWSAVGLILLIVCVNLSNLLLARAAARSKEFNMRSALGATRGRIVRQLLTESLILAGAGAALGLCFAFAATLYLAHQSSMALPLLSTVRVDLSALAWTVLLAIAAAVLFGFLPALKMSDFKLQEGLKDSGQGVSHGRKHERLKAALVISEVALACILLVGAGLLMRSFLRVLDVDLGFEPSRASAIDIDYDDGGKREKRGAILAEILRRVQNLPGIESAGVADMLPLERNRSWGLEAKGRIYRPGELQGTMVYIITPEYVRAIGMHVRAGRDFSWRDSAASERVVIINEATARFHWPGQDPVGRIALVNGKDTRVVGVIANVRESSVEEASSQEMYLPMTQADPEGSSLVVRSSIPPAALRGSVMAALRELNPEQPATQFRPIQQIVDHAVSPRRFFVLLVAIFAALGLILAALGIYGVISYSVAERKLEIGIRMALGATQSRVQLGVLGKTLSFVAIGIAAGIVGSLATAKLVASLLFGTAPTDGLVFGLMTLILGTIALAAGYIPARRAASVDPMRALRSN